MFAHPRLALSLVSTGDRPVASKLFFFVFTFSMVLICFNVVIAILTASYEYINTLEHDSIHRMMRLDVTTYLRIVRMRFKDDLMANNGNKARVHSLSLVIASTLCIATTFALGIYAGIYLTNKNRGWTTILAVISILLIAATLLFGSLHRIIIYVVERWMIPNIFGGRFKDIMKDECRHRTFELVLKRAQNKVRKEKGFMLSEFCDAVVSDR